MTGKAPEPDKPDGVFDFSDLQALREEYEERIARIERERDAALDIVKKDAEKRIAALQAQQAHQMQSEAAARKELIEDLTIELANAREDGERRAQAAEKQAAADRQRLEIALQELLRIDADVQRLKAFLTPVPVEQPAPMQPVATVTMSTTPPQGTAAPANAAQTPVAATSTPPTSTPPAQTQDATGLVVQKRRKIRLR